MPCTVHELRGVGLPALVSYFQVRVVLSLLPSEENEEVADTVKHPEEHVDL